MESARVEPARMEPASTMHARLRVSQPCTQQAQPDAGSAAGKHTAEPASARSTVTGDAASGDRAEGDGDDGHRAGGSGTGGYAATEYDARHP